MTNEVKKEGEGFIPTIVGIVCSSTGISMELIHSKTRKREVVEARQFAMRIAKALTNCSLATIGQNIGNKDHATVLHGCKTINNLCDSDKKFKAKYDDVFAMCKSKSRMIRPNMLVCGSCGTKDVQIRAWIDANTRKEVDPVSDGEVFDNWCTECQRPVNIVTRAEYAQLLDILDKNEAIRAAELEKTTEHKKQIDKLEEELEI